MDLTESTGNITLHDFFSYCGRPVSNLSDYWGWRSELIAAQLIDMLDQLQDFIQEIRQTGNIDQKEMAGNLSNALKSFAEKNGVCLENASFEDLSKLKKLLQEKIIELLKQHASRAVDQSKNSDSAKNTPTGIFKKETSLSEPIFQTKILLALLNSFKRDNESINDSL